MSAHLPCLRPVQYHEHFLPRATTFSRVAQPPLRALPPPPPRAGEGCDTRSCILKVDLTLAAAAAAQSRGRPKVRAPNYQGIGDKGILEKRAPANPKYANVGAKLHTGNRWRDDLTFTRPKRKNEFFGRVKSELLVRILDENEDAEESLYNLASENGDPYAMGKQVVVDASATGGGGGGGGRKPYVLLDMRDQSAYDAFHIRGGALRRPAVPPSSLP